MGPRRYEHEENKIDDKKDEADRVLLEDDSRKGYVLVRLVPVS